MPFKRTTAQKAVLPLIVATALVGATSATIIGMASSQSNLVLDNSKVSGNATLFDGSVVESTGYSRLQLKNGTRMDLAAGSGAKVFANKATLDHGMSEIQSASGFEIDANTLKIRTTGSDAVARVKVENKAVMVTALNAPVEVLNPAGLLIAKVTPGLPLSFMPQAGAATAFDGKGCVVNKDGTAVLVTDDGGQKYDIRGKGVPGAVGKSAHVVGTINASATPGGGATQVIAVTSITASKADCKKALALIPGATATAAGLAAGAGAAAAGAAAGAGAAAAGAGAAAGAAAAVGVSTTALVVGGVAAATAAAVGGAAAAGSFSSSSPD